MRSAPFVWLLALAATLVSACTTHQTEVPGLAGPSEFGTSIGVTASPDHVRQDGASQSTIVVTALNPNSQPVSGLAVRLEMAVDGTLRDFGTLSARNVVTGGDGRATVTYTAPPAPPPSSGGAGTTMTILATPVGTNAQNEMARSASIELVPPGVILPPGGTPTAQFVVSPTPVSVGVPTRFDASSSTPGTNATQLSYTWSFGDGASANGVNATHTFRTAGTFSATLTVTNERGLSANATQAVTVTATELPTADFVFSPAAPAPLAQVQFNAQASEAGPGRNIVQYLWSWGDGETGTGVTQQHDYAQAGNYTVTLTVVDDLGQRASKSTGIVVGVSAPTADFVFSPSTPVPGAPVQFNAQISSAPSGRRIAQYSWNFGDGTAEASGPLQEHRFAAQGVYTVVLTVVDDLGQRGIKAITVPVGTPLNAAFTFNPGNPAAGASVGFDASSSTAGAGRTIARYQWTWGDGTTAPSLGAIQTHAFAAPGTYTVVLTVTDNQGQSDQVSQTVTVSPSPSP